VKTCIDCAYYVSENGWGRCRRYPPFAQHHRDASLGHTAKMVPLVWCGDDYPRVCPDTPACGELK
jgi:hypothetical protein